MNLFVKILAGVLLPFISSCKENQLLAFPVNLQKGMSDALTNQCIEFKNAIKGNRTPAVSGQEGIESNTIIEAVFESSRLGCEIQLNKLKYLDKYQ